MRVCRCMLRHGTACFLLLGGRFHVLLDVTGVARAKTDSRFPTLRLKVRGPAASQMAPIKGDPGARCIRRAFEALLGAAVGKESRPKVGEKMLKASSSFSPRAARPRDTSSILPSRVLTYIAAACREQLHVRVTFASLGAPPGISESTRAHNHRSHRSCSMSRL